MEDFEIIGSIEAIETIAIANAIRDIARLRLIYGQGRWRKLKGVATIELTEEIEQALYAIEPVF